MSSTVFEMQLQGRASGKTIIAAGGKCLVTLGGAMRKAVLTDPDNNNAPLANPISPIRGKLRFAIANAGNATPGSTTVDIYGISPLGHAYLLRGCMSGDPTEVYIDENIRTEVLVLPFSYADVTAGAEQDTGFDLPVGATLQPVPIATVTTLEAGRTLNIGLLSTQAGGNASGFVTGLSLAAAGPVKATNQGAGTVGALLKTTPSGGSAGLEEALITTAGRISYTLSAGAVAAEGFFSLSYNLSR